MDSQEAQRVLKSLADGTDPFTGKEISPESVLQNATVLRALIRGAEAIEYQTRRAQRRSMLPKNAGQPWTDAQTEELLKDYSSGRSIAQLATKYDRTDRGIHSRLEMMGKLRSEDSKKNAKRRPHSKSRRRISTY